MELAKTLAHFEPGTTLHSLLIAAFLIAALALVLGMMVRLWEN